MIHHLIWDFDGTIMDSISRLAESFALFVQRSGMEINKDAAYRIRKQGEEKWREFLTETAEQLNFELDVFRKQFQDYALQRDQDSEPYPHVWDVCSYIVKQNGSNHIVSRSSRDRIEVHLAKLGYSELFGEIIGANEGLPKKPDPAALLHILQKHNIDRDKAMGIGDQESDIKAASSAGIMTCLFDPDQIAEVEADVVVRDYTQLREFLAHQAGG